MNYKELQEIIKEDKKIYFNEKFQKKFFHILTRSFSYDIGKYIIIARKSGYFKENRNSIVNKIKCIFYTRKKNILGKRLGIELMPSKFGRRLRIWHGNVIVNYDAQIGDDCQFHGNNCVGVGTNGNCPLIGNNVNICVGANIIGKVIISDGTTVGANSFVNKEFLEKNIVIAGVPAKKIK